MRSLHPERAIASLLVLAAGLFHMPLAQAFVVGPELEQNSHAVVQDMNAGWRFHLGDAPGAQAATFADSDWAKVDVPHDWSIAGPRSVDAATGMPGGYVPAGLGWYRKTFTVLEGMKRPVVLLHFEGVYGVTELWLNDRPLGRHSYGYTPFTFDISAEVRRDGPNVLAVRVDNSVQPNSRWYSGSGIYRRVWLDTTNPVHIPQNGVFVTTTECSEKHARLRVQTTVQNSTDTEHEMEMETHVSTPNQSDPDRMSTRVVVPAHGSTTVEQTISIEWPALWSPETPKLNTLISRLTSGKDSVDVVETSFGIRTVHVSPDRGFELNGHPLKLNGACVHHDHGALGAASYRVAEFRRVQLLKAEGFNAVRTAHNPPSPAFLDACDQLGLLVMDEAFDCWEKGKNSGDYSRFFKEGWQRDLDAMVLRDRNHPAVVLWSIGNEVNEKGTPEGLPLARRLAARVRELDPTRPVSCGWNFPWNQAKWEDMDPMFAALDVAGINYEHNRHADDHRRVPGRVMLATETYQSATFEAWAVAQDNPYFIGDFVWSGIDYLGESGIGRVYPPGEKLFQHWEKSHWPWYGAYCGDIDITGWRKPISHYRNIVWDRGEKLYMAVQEPTADGRPWQPTLWALPPSLDSWTWPGQEGKPLTVEVYSRHDRVRLFLDGKLLGEKPTTRAEQFKAVFTVPYAAGALKAVGITAGREAGSFVLETAGQPVGVRLRPDYADKEFEQSEPTFLVAEIIDANGRVVPTADTRIEFSVSKGTKILAVATGDLTSPEPFVATSRRVWHGRAQVIVMPPKPEAGKANDITVTATLPELGNATTTVKIPTSVVMIDG